MLVRLGQHIGFVTKPFVNLTPLATRRLATTLIAPSVLYSWSSVTISSTFGFVGGGGVGEGDGDGPADVNAEIDASATSAASSLRARIVVLRSGSGGRPYRAGSERSTQRASGDLARGRFLETRAIEPALDGGKPSVGRLELGNVTEIGEHAQLEPRMPLRGGFGEAKRNEAIPRAVEQQRRRRDSSEDRLAMSRM